MSLTPRFGISLDPTVRDPQELFHLAKLADENGLDLLTIQDHPYQPRFYETWTLLTALATVTRKIHISPNVTNLPLRLPAMLAKQAATLDVLTNGRMELGMGAGGFWDAIASFGGPKRSPAEAYSAFEDALYILKGLWESSGTPFTYQGKVYSVTDAQFGPIPLHHIPIWVGAFKPKMMRLTGRMANGILLSMPYTPPETLPKINNLVDEGAHEAGRSPDVIRHGYNLMGIIRSGSTNFHESSARPGLIVGTAGHWVNQLVRFYTTYRQDTFILSGAGDSAQQIERFAQDVAPAVKEKLLDDNQLERKQVIDKSVQRTGEINERIT